MDGIKINKLLKKIAKKNYNKIIKVISLYLYQFHQKEVGNKN
jgi:hypothetical protein